MSANSFGHLFKVTTFGESHGEAVGVVIDGCPAGVNFSLELLLANLNRRRPGQSNITTSRNESDTPQVLSGVFENKTLGTPICIIVKNENKKSEDYLDIKNNPRIGHADDVWVNKFGHTDYRGGGRASGRETLTRVIAGSVAQMFCQSVISDLQIKGFVAQISNYKLPTENILNLWNLNIDEFVTRLPDKAMNNEIVTLLEKAKLEGESYGGIVEVVIKNVPVGLGQPVFHKFKSDLAAAVTSIGAANSFEFGSGFEAVNKSGTEFHTDSASSNYGGIRGGITTGSDINFRVGFKPTSSINDVAKKGRHDPCIVPRAVPVVEAMAWLIMADHLLWVRTDRV